MAEFPGTLDGYRSGRDTISNTSILVYDLYEGFQRKQETVAVALDL